VTLNARMIARTRGFGLVVVFAALAGCADGQSKGGDPGAKPLPPGTTCQGLKVELDRMVSKGTAQGSESGRYNQVLAQYLGARCHV
jgi:hypothetical protein